VADRESHCTLDEDKALKWAVGDMGAVPESQEWVWMPLSSFY